MLIDLLRCKGVEIIWWEGNQGDYDITGFGERLILPIRLQYQQNMRVQDTWFLLLISAIEAQLRLVGEISAF
jgi:hypothetical protein